MLSTSGSRAAFSIIVVPSASDAAWTEIFGNRPLPGYQRTYYSAAANREVSVNGKIQNLLDREYEERKGYPAPGIHFLLGAEVRI